MIAALRARMKAVGLDINPDYRNIFEKRLSLFEINGEWEYKIQDARTLADVMDHGSAEICITSPPYWDILNRKRSADRKASKSYSSNGHDIGNICDYDKFLDAIVTVSKQVGLTLRSRGYFILNVMDIRKGPVFYPLHHDASDTVVRSGTFALEDIIIWDRQAEYNSMRPLGYPHKFIINKVHEYLLVFRKTGN